MKERSKVLIVLLIILTAISFFQLSALGEQFFKIGELAGIFIIVFLWALTLFYDKSNSFKHNFNYPLILIFFGVFLSMFMASSGHDQDFYITAIAQRMMYFYLLYFLLHNLRIRQNSIEKIILGIAILYALLFMIQFIIYPKIIFETRIEQERGTLRIFLPGLSFLIISYFYSINKILLKHKFIFLIPALLFLVIFILLGTRQILFSVLFVTLLNIIFSGTFTSKFIITPLLVICIFTLYFMFQNVFDELLQVTKEQSTEWTDDPRVKAAQYFLDDFYPNRIAYITGNGAHSLNSPYGVQIESVKINKGLYQSDIGILGDFTKYGFFFILGVFLIFWKVFSKKLLPEFIFIRYFFLFIGLTLLVSGGEFTGASAIVAVVMLLYLVDISEHKRNYLKTNSKSEV
jgi:hypothetical protein